MAALATPGHAPAHAAYLVADRRRGSEEPWLAFTGDSLLVGDVGRPDLHAHGDPGGMARELFASLGRLLELPDGVAVYPSHYGGSVCGRSLSSNPFSTIGFERRHNAALQHTDADSFTAALLSDLPPAPARRHEPPRAAGSARQRGPVRPVERAGRRRLLIAGWLIAVPVSAMIGLARAGAGSSPRTCCSARTRALPGR